MLRLAKKCSKSLASVESSARRVFSNEYAISHLKARRAYASTLASHISSLL